MQPYEELGGTRLSCMEDGVQMLLSLPPQSTAEFSGNRAVGSPFSHVAGSRPLESGSLRGAAEAGKILGLLVTEQPGLTMLTTWTAWRPPGW